MQWALERSLNNKILPLRGVRAGELAGVWALRKCLDHVGSRALFVITRWAWRLLSSIFDSLYPVDQWFPEQDGQNSIHITRKLALRVNSWDHPVSTESELWKGGPGICVSTPFTWLWCTFRSESHQTRPVVLNQGDFASLLSLTLETSDHVGRHFWLLQYGKRGSDTVTISLRVWPFLV